ncbi:MAG: hypothetical protein QOH46_1997, partial [Solirubrobacteraceae bacterium]|nr:hypothetical protein [Solirubrobacteraceae bacterium]
MDGTGSNQPSTPEPLAASYREAAAAAVRIGVGYVPPAFASLVRDAKASSLMHESTQMAERVDAVWRLVEEAWDRVPPSTP